MVEFALKAAQNQNGDSLALVSSERIKEEDLKMILQRIVEKSQKQHKITVDIGIGTEVKYLEDVKISRKEAADAIRNAAMAGASGQIYRYREQGIYTLISKIQDDKFLDKYVEKQIGSLIRADALNKGNLCETLESYLNHNCNLKETAQALYIHRNTMNYRMNKIKEILGEDFEKIVEPFQGEGGFIPAPIEWVKAVRKICDDNGISMIADEVQCGNCRTGKYFASEYWKEAGAAPAGTIGGTFCGNPLSCAAALVVMDIMKKDDYAAKARHIGEVVTKRYKELQEKYPVIGDVRGFGAMIGVEFVKDREEEALKEALNV